jgi:hypothetical protein
MKGPTSAILLLVCITALFAIPVAMCFEVLNGGIIERLCGFGLGLILALQLLRFFNQRQLDRHAQKRALAARIKGSDNSAPLGSAGRPHQQPAN